MWFEVDGNLNFLKRKNVVKNAKKHIPVANWKFSSPFLHLKPNPATPQIFRCGDPSSCPGGIPGSCNGGLINTPCSSCPEGGSFPWATFLGFGVWMKWTKWFTPSEGFIQNPQLFKGDVWFVVLNHSKSIWEFPFVLGINWNFRVFFNRDRVNPQFCWPFSPVLNLET